MAKVFRRIKSLPLIKRFLSQEQDESEDANANKNKNQAEDGKPEVKTKRRSSFRGGLRDSFRRRFGGSKKRSKSTSEEAPKAEAAAATPKIEEAPPFNGLGTRQVFLLKQSWKGVMRDETEFGIDLFIRLFKTNASLKSMFDAFKDIKTDDELRSNEALEYHATLVMSTLDDAITHIDNYEFVCQLLHRTGASHLKFRDFKPEYFQEIKEPFLEAVRVTLGDRYTDNMQNIYTVAVTFILDTLMEGINEAMGTAGQATNGDV